MQKQNSKQNRIAVARISLALAALAISVSSCAPTFHQAETLASKIDESLGCKSFEESLWSAFGASVEKYGRPPTAAEIENAIQSQLKGSSRVGKISKSAQRDVSALTSEIAATVAGGGIDQLVQAKQTEMKSAGVDETVPLDEDVQRGLWLERIAQLEIGDRTTQAKSDDVDRIQGKIAELKALAEREGLTEKACITNPAATPSPNPVTASSMIDGWKATQVPPVVGALRTVATIYQSCDAATHAPLGSETSNVQGISVVGRHSTGGGNVREITNKSSYLATQPYIGSSVYKRPLPNCFDVQATPSIYDFGGKPYTSTSNEKVLNLFKNGGTGSRELGIDCSALVYSAYATVGLKFKKETSLKASLVDGVSSTMLTEPKKNGLTCLDHASFTAKKNLAPGDIIAIKGHVVMVASVGSDPFGIASITSASECRASNISISRFNFNIFQSDPSKGGIGVNQMRARYYLSSFSTMGQGMIDHAVNACKAKFSGSTIVSKSSSASVVRHLGTAECKDATPVQLTKEECLSSCSARPVESI